MPEGFARFAARQTHHEKRKIYHEGHEVHEELTNAVNASFRVAPSALSEGSSENLHFFVNFVSFVVGLLFSVLIRAQLPSF